MIERRSEPRFLFADLVLVHIDDARGGWEVIANLEDISPSEVRVFRLKPVCPRALPFS